MNLTADTVMKRILRRFRLTALVTALAVWPLSALSVATLVWTGGGASGLWSDPANWNIGRAPAAGDDVTFSGNPAWSTNTLDLPLSLASLTFTPTAELFFVHVSGDGGSSLAFTGLGIQNLTAGGGPIRQALFADAGTTGGTILFANSSGISLGNSGQPRPVDVTALGGSAPGAIGGHIVFQDASSNGSQTFSALRAEGASVVGASGGELILRNNAVTTRSTTITITGGTVLGAAGGRASFEDAARVEGNLNVLSGTGGGQGGRAAFRGNVVGGLSIGLYNSGASSSERGAEAVISFHDNARFTGTAVNWAGAGAGYNGGRLEFHDSARFDSSGTDPTFGGGQILNAGSAVAGAGGGSVVFADDTFIRGARLLINNTVEIEAPVAGSAGGSAEFRDRSRAGEVTIYNAGASSGAPGTLGGRTSFSNASSAQSATVVSYGGVASGTFGGSLQFADDASAGAATLQNLGGLVAGAGGGTTSFGGRASAANATLVNAPGAAAGALGGSTIFSGNAAAGNAFISNNVVLVGVGGRAGTTEFRDSATAQRAVIDNQGGAASIEGAYTVFSGRATAANAAITNFGGRSLHVSGGATLFYDDTSAGAASIVSTGGGVTNTSGGLTEFNARATAQDATFSVRAGQVAGAFGAEVGFRQQSSAGSARFTLDGATLAGAYGGVVYFRDLASAADASFTVAGSSVAGIQSVGAGAVSFRDTTTAGRATFAVGAGAAADALGGVVAFDGRDALRLSNAGSANIRNLGSSVEGAFGGITAFLGTSSAASSTIVNGGDSVRDTGKLAGRTVFRDNATAGHAAITNLSGSVPNAQSGQTFFYDSASAGDAMIVNAGGTGGFLGGITQFYDTSTAGRATLVSRASPAGLSVGATYFWDNSTAGDATLIAEGSGNLGSRGLVVFNGGSGGNATLIAGAATAAGGFGGAVAFTGSSTVGNSTLIAQGGTAAGTRGGLIQILGSASGGRARAVLDTGVNGGLPGQLDIRQLSVGGTAIGSVEGGGIVSLGSKNLQVGANNLSTTFSGLIRDGGGNPATGGSLTVIGAGALTLTGANTYTGATRIGDGINANSGKLNANNVAGSATGAGPVFVERGGTLGGSGFIAGPVSLRAGGTIAPGDPVTLTLHDSLTWDGGGVIRLVLGANSAGSDHLELGALIRGADGEFRFDFVDLGIVAGESYELIHFDSLFGFGASDFSFSGVAGNFNLENGRLDFTAAAVPEPSAAWLLAAGMLLLIVVQRRAAGLPGLFKRIPARNDSASSQQIDSLRVVATDGRLPAVLATPKLAPLILWFQLQNQ